MKQTYLFRLFQHSVPAFLFLVVFLCVYAVSFSKKMDMVFFPYNNMYSSESQGSANISTYAARKNDSLVHITSYPYWKKDFLETALFNYCRYIERGNRVYLEDYFKYRFPEGAFRSYLLNKLIPDKSAVVDWPAWFTRFAGKPAVAGDQIEFIKYDFAFSHGTMKLIGSRVINKYQVHP